MIKKGQMDMLIRYCDTSTNAVSTKHYNSEFLGKASANLVQTKFEICSSSLDLKKKMIQVYFNNFNSPEPSNPTSLFLSLNLQSFLMKLNPSFTFSVGPE